MIGYLSGKVAERDQTGCFLDVQGVGYRLSCSTQTLASLPTNGGSLRLWTHLHVREDQLALYGFATLEEQQVFEALLGVAGVGPKVALQVCSAFSPEAFRRALVTDDANGLAAIPGIGKKTAQRILVDLKGRLALPDLEIATGRNPVTEARSALENLGYSPGEVRAVLGEIDLNAEDDVESIVRSALKVLA